jgi:heme A synthase
MKTVYRVLAYAIAALVAVQAAAIGYAVFAQMSFIEGGGTLDSASIESAPGTGAYIFHALNAATILLAALALLIVSFFAKIPQGVRWAVIVLACTVVQIVLGALHWSPLVSRLVSAIGAVHGAVALVLFGVAVMAAMRARKPAAVEETVSASVA